MLSWKKILLISSAIGVAVVAGIVAASRGRKKETTVETSELFKSPVLKLTERLKLAAMRLLT